MSCFDCHYFPVKVTSRKGTGFLRKEDLQDLASEEEEQEEADEADILSFLTFPHPSLMSVALAHTVMRIILYPFDPCIVVSCISQAADISQSVRPVP